MNPAPILHAGRLRWAEPVTDGSGWLIHCVDAPADSAPPLYPSEATAFADITEIRAALPADWSKDL